MAEGSTRWEAALPDKIDLRYRISSANEPKTFGASRAPSAATRSIKATLTCLSNACEIEFSLRCGAGVLEDDFVLAAAGDFPGALFKLFCNCRA